MKENSATECTVHQLAVQLLAAWESGDRQRLKTAVERTASTLRRPTEASPLESEYREALMSVVERFDEFLRTGETVDDHNRLQLQVCCDLLRHVLSNSGNC